VGVILVASHPVHGERRIELDSEIWVGTDATDDLRLEPPVGARHMRFVYRDARVIAVDYRSALGTFLNGRRIDQPTIVRPGHEVSVGDWVIRADENERPEKPFRARVERERELLAALHANPADDDLRQVYGDWLEENGHAKEAEVISLEREIRDGEGRIDDAALGRLGFRLRTLAASLPFSWRVAVTRPKIENCHQRHACPRTWERLSSTESLVVRHCEACAQPVHFAETMDIARHHVSQNHRVALDVSVERYPRDLEVALARLPAAPTTAEEGTTALPFFSTDDPPSTVGALVRSLNLVPPDHLGRGGDMGFFRVPNMLVDESGSPASALITSLSIRYRWDMYHEEPKTHFRQIEHSGYESFAIAFAGDGDLIDDWLGRRFGPPREAMEAQTHPEVPAGTYRIHGAHWLFRESGDGGGYLRWESRLPDWALPPTDTRAALRFLNELAHLLREDCTHDRLVEFASRPPPRSGVVVRGPLNRSDFWLLLEPQLTALEVAHALEIAGPIGWSGDVHMSSWSVIEKDSPSRLGYPSYGRWVIDVGLDRWPSGRDVEGRYASQHLAPEDKARSICVRPFDA
jgi:uncharacterized protein (TIGR02996 family)